MIPARARQRGLSLIELMIASSLGLLSVAAVGNVFVGGSSNYRQEQKLSRMQDELSFAMTQLTQDLEMAGFWSRVHDSALIERPAGVAVGNDCGPAGWALQDLTSLAIDDNATAASANALHPCLATADVQSGADILAIKRVRGRAEASDTNASALVTGRTYLRTHEGRGALFLQGGSAPSIAQPFQDWEYRPRLYFVQPYSASPLESPRVPSLCRMVLRADNPPRFAKECLAQGVENMQLEVGVDSDADGVANFFSQAPTPADLARAVAVRVYLLVRSATPDPAYRNEKTYRVGNAPDLTPKEKEVEVHYYRKTLASEVVLRNARSLGGVGYQ